MKSLVIGYGSIGSRHARNLRSLGHEVLIDDNDANKLELANSDGFLLHTSETDIDFAVVCSPTEHHMKNALEVLGLGITNIFIEKPLSYDVESAKKFIYEAKKRNARIMCGCNLRFDNGIKLVKLLLEKGIGTIFSVDYTFGHDLRQWHPDQDYTKSYSAGKYGGIDLDDIHAIDLIEYLFGEIKEVYGIFRHTGLLKIEQDDIVEYVFSTDIVVGRIHSDYLNQEYTRNMYITGSEGNIIWNFANHEVLLFTKELPQWRVFKTDDDLNSMYVDEMRYFTNCIESNTIPFCDGLHALQVVEQAAHV